MTDTLWPDISSYQPYLGKIPYRAVAIRSNDGTYRDQHFARNLAQCKKAVAAGDFDFFLVYLVFETNWSETFATFKAMVGTPHPRMAVMIDVESWGGKIRGNHSTQIDALRDAIVKWLGSYQRVGAYANAYDKQNMMPSVQWPWFVLANYSANPANPYHFAHQFTDRYPVPGLGNVDMNSADGYSVAACMKVLGVAPKPTPAPTPDPAPVPVAPEDDMPKLFEVDPKSVPKGTAWPGLFVLAGNLYRHVPPTGVVAVLEKAGLKPVVISYKDHQHMSAFFPSK